MPCFRWLLRLFGSSQLNRICIYNTAYTKPRVLRNTSPLGDDLEFDLSYLFGLSYERALKSPMHRSGASARYWARLRLMVRSLVTACRTSDSSWETRAQTLRLILKGLLNGITRAYNYQLTDTCYSADGLPARHDMYGICTRRD